jgi:N-acetylglutamate synthase-like GNAT family acetyltransferase
MSHGISVEQRNDPAAVERILRSLPAWFGIESALNDYVTSAATSTSFVAVRAGEVVGVALSERHFAESAELTLLAVHADHRGTGAGHRLVAAVQADLAADGCRFLEVHTVGPSCPDAGYAETRAFYRAVGFSPMHEFDGIDWPGPTLILIKSLKLPDRRRPQE